MAEYCMKCAEKHLGLSPADLKRAVMSEDSELCEGCGEYKPVVVRIKPTLAERWDELGWKLRRQLENNKLV